MADVQNPGATAAPRRGDGGPASPEANRPVADAEARTFDASAQRAAADKAADARSAAAKANSEILNAQIDTAQQAVHSGMEMGMRSFEGVAQTLTRAFGLTVPNPDLAEQSAQNMRAVSQASSALARGVQGASRIWLDLSQKSLRINLDAIGRLANCRSIQEVATVQSGLMCDHLKQAIDSGEAIARAHSDAIQEATRVIQPPTQPPR